MGSNARRLEPNARVMAFIDGQNVLKTCETLYGHGRVHPALLAKSVLAGRTLAGVRYYSGIPDPRIQRKPNARVQRRHALIRRSGVTVVERMVRYRWDWGFDSRLLPDPREAAEGSTHSVEVNRFQRGREKGIDLALGLDVVDLSLRQLMDVVVIFSFDEDLTEVARMVHSMTRKAGRVSVEAAIFNDRGIKRLQHYDYTHQLNRNDFEEAKDEFDYRAELDPLMVKLFLQVLGKDLEDDQIV